MFKYVNDESPPVCLHILGQSLVNSIHAEARELKAKLEAMTSQQKIRQLPEGAMGHAIKEAHAIADAKWAKATGGSSQYQSEKILYYDEDTWARAYESVINEVKYDV